MDANIKEQYIAKAGSFFKEKMLLDHSPHSKPCTRTD
ncbi:uncharacterized protein G2W53_031087 [Senna tora]|uniref:Uncharacterized protein n=1 Tax=Senna tora TaxID=362788 RepID=A0A834T789_9FABA|nr:uncharacterized protein G2W53_031087 [Senna tora]